MYTPNLSDKYYITKLYVIVNTKTFLLMSEQTAAQLCRAYKRVITEQDRTLGSIPEKKDK